MMKITSPVLLLSFMTMSAYSQSVILKFTALLNGTHVNIDSVRVSNLTHPGDTILHWPDTTLVLNYNGIPEIRDGHAGFILTQCSENPVNEKEVIQLWLPAAGDLDLRVNDISGIMLTGFTKHLSPGWHTFQYRPAHPGACIISARYLSEVKSMKIICTGEIPGNNILEYAGMGKINTPEKSALADRDITSQYFVYSLGDSLLMKGWYNGSSAILKTATQTNSTFTFGFGMNFPCPGLPQFTYSGQTYNTLQIGTQCWMKENLNIGNMMPSTSTGLSHSDCSNNGIIEKYCYNDDPANCTVYGGLYDWDEMMQYTTNEGTQGICPPGWHIPTDAEWCTMTTFLDPAVICNIWGALGVDAGGQLKDTGTAHWASPNTGATNLSGFAAPGAGYRLLNGVFNNQGIYADIWTSTQYNSTFSINRYLNSTSANVFRNDANKTYGFSVRCVKN